MKKRLKLIKVSQASMGIYGNILFLSHVIVYKVFF